MLHNSQLNIIYFVDANKTRSFKISLRSALILLIFSTVVLLWSLGSLVVLREQISTIQGNEKRITSLLDIIFDYQCRYDHAFDRAYPQNQKQEKTGEIATNAPKPSVVAANPVAPVTQENAGKQTTEELKENREPASQESFTEENGGEAEAPASPTLSTTQNFNVAVETLKIALFHQKLQIRFAMRNTDSPTQNEGYVLGVGKFITDDGATIYVPTPSDINLDPASGRPTSMRLGYRFSIKYYKKRTMDFPAPRGKAGHFVSATIFTSHKYEPQGVVEIKIPTGQSTIMKDDATDRTVTTPDTAETEGADQ